MCYGSDEEQTRTAATEAAESYVIHTEFWREKEREKDEEQHIVLHDSPLIKATSTGGKQKAFYYWCNIQVEAVKNTGHPCLI